MMKTPYCLAMLLCDHVYRDRSTGRASVLGIDNAFHLPAFPGKLRLFVYGELTDGVGEFRVSARLSDASFEFEGESDRRKNSPFNHETPSSKIHLKQPTMIAQVVINMVVNIPKPGQYHCDLLVNDASVMSRRVLVRIAREAPPREAEEE